MFLNDHDRLQVYNSDNWFLGRGIVVRYYIFVDKGPNTMIYAISHIHSSRHLRLQLLAIDQLKCNSRTLKFTDALSPFFHVRKV